MQPKLERIIQSINARLGWNVPVEEIEKIIFEDWKEDVSKWNAWLEVMGDGDIEQISEIIAGVVDKTVNVGDSHGFAAAIYYNQYALSLPSPAGPIQIKLGERAQFSLDIIRASASILLSRKVTDELVFDILLHLYGDDDVSPLLGDIQKMTADMAQKTGFVVAQEIKKKQGQGQGVVYDVTPERLTTTTPPEPREIVYPPSFVDYIERTAGALKELDDWALRFQDKASEKGEVNLFADLNALGVLLQAARGVVEKLQGDDLESLDDDDQDEME